MKQQKPLTIKEVSSQFSSWRKNRTGKSRIPKQLWQNAISLHPDYPIGEITRSLRLGYSDFKKKYSQTEQQKDSTTFVRVAPSVTSIEHISLDQSNRTCIATTIDLEKGDGSRIRIQRELNCQAVLDIVGCYFGEA